MYAGLGCTSVYSLGTQYLDHDFAHLFGHPLEITLRLRVLTRVLSDVLIFLL